jgi:hypothetical protein
MKRLLLSLVLVIAFAAPALPQGNIPDPGVKPPNCGECRSSVSLPVFNVLARQILISLSIL